MQQTRLLFEAGALSKQVHNNPVLVAPLLIGFKGRRDLPPPLGRFQTTLPTKDDMFKLVNALNEACAEDRRRDPISLKTVFEKWWDDFEGPFQEIESSQPSSPVRPREDSEVLAEVLDIVRAMQATQSAPTASAPKVDLKDWRDDHERISRGRDFVDTLLKTAGQEAAERAARDKQLAVSAIARQYDLVVLTGSDTWAGFHLEVRDDGDYLTTERRVQSFIDECRKDLNIDVGVAVKE